MPYEALTHERGCADKTGELPRYGFWPKARKTITPWHTIKRAKKLLYIEGKEYEFLGVFFFSI